MHSVVQNSMRGGRCEVILRYADAYNKYINEELDKNKKSVYLMSLDANSLYGVAMTFKLPYKIHEWIEDLSVITTDFIKSYDIDEMYCYIIQVDIECPPEIHDILFDYPVLCERKKVKDSRVEKLVSTFNKKEKLVLHIYMLQHALNLGYKIKKIHRAIKFEQKDFLKPYTELRKKKHL